MKRTAVLQWSGFLGFFVFLTAAMELAADREQARRAAEREADQKAGAIALVLVNAMRDAAASEDLEAADCTDVLEAHGVTVQ